MATGKTTIGKKLAKQLTREFVDTDALIVARQGLSIPEIFEQFGETTFRKLETEIAVELAGKEGLVISTGGRMMLDPKNVAALSKTGRIFCLIATPEEILNRLSSDTVNKRPLLEVANPGAKIIELLEERRQGYSQFLKVITNDKEPSEITNDLLDFIHEEPQKISIEHPAEPYEYIVGSGILPFLRQLSGTTGKMVVITDETLKKYYQHSCGDVDHIISIPAGSSEKTLQTVQSIYDQLIEIGFDRSDTIVSFGGSVVCDIAGFVAATYMRGVNLIHCPTSLLAMADTSIGGKTSLDLPQGKNLIGVFKQPSLVIADVATLQTLPKKEFISGMAEVIKHGLIADSDLLERVQTGHWHHEFGTLFTSLFEMQELVAKAIQVKISFIQADPFDYSQRSTLNFGHTFAHAIEHISQNKIRHGEAVAMGIVASANLSHRLGYCSKEIQQQIEGLFTQTGLPIRIPSYCTPESILKAMKNDKKRKGNSLRLVLPIQVGETVFCENASSENIMKTLVELSDTKD